MARTNYGFEKRQREMAKKQKKEEKLRLKKALNEPPAEGEATAADATQAPAAPPDDKTPA